jgi:hypothetical protein
MGFMYNVGLYLEKDDPSFGDLDATYQQNQQQFNSVFLLQQISEQYFQHNKPAKRTECSPWGWIVIGLGL